MAPHLTAKAPQCLLCIRRVTRLGDSVSLSAGQQIRGKKKLAKISSVDVQLLQNVPGYGRRGELYNHPVNLLLYHGTVLTCTFRVGRASYARSDEKHLVPEEDCRICQSYQAQRACESGYCHRTGSYFWVKARTKSCEGCRGRPTSSSNPGHKSSTSVRRFCLED